MRGLGTTSAGSASRGAERGARTDRVAERHQETEAEEAATAEEERAGDRDIELEPSVHEDLRGTTCPKSEGREDSGVGDPREVGARCDPHVHGGGEASASTGGDHELAGAASGIGGTGGVFGFQMAGEAVEGDRQGRRPAPSGADEGGWGVNKAWRVGTLGPPLAAAGEEEGARGRSVPPSEGPGIGQGIGALPGVDGIGDRGGLDLGHARGQHHGDGRDGALTRTKGVAGERDEGGMAALARATVRPVPGEELGGGLVAVTHQGAPEGAREGWRMGDREGGAGGVAQDEPARARGGGAGGEVELSHPAHRRRAWRGP